MYTIVFTLLEGCLEGHPFGLSVSHEDLLPLTPLQSVTTSSAFPWPAQGPDMLNNKLSVSHNCAPAKKKKKKSSLCHAKIKTFPLFYVNACVSTL